MAFSMLSPLGDVYVGSRGRVVCIRGRQDLPATDPDYTMLRKCFLRSLDHLHCYYPDCSVIRKSYLRIVGSCVCAAFMIVNVLAMCVRVASVFM